MSRIRYSLREIPFDGDGEKRYSATVRKGENYSQDDLIELMVKRHTSLTRQDIQGVISLMNEVILDEVVDGNRIGTDLFKAYVSIKGAFQSEKERWDRKKHPVEVHTSPTRRFRKSVARRAKVRRVEPVDHYLCIFGFYDYVTRSHGDRLSAGGLVNLRGADLLLWGDQIRLSLKPEGSDERYYIEEIHEATDRNILFSLPEGLEEKRYLFIAELCDGKRTYRVSYDDFITIANPGIGINSDE